MSEWPNDIREIRTDLQRIGNHIERIDADVRKLGNRVAGLTGITSVLGVAIIAILISQFVLWQEVGRLDGRLAGISAQLGEITTLLRQHAGG